MTVLMIRKMTANDLGLWRVATIDRLEVALHNRSCMYRDTGITLAPGIIDRARLALAKHRPFSSQDAQCSWVSQFLLREEEEARGGNGESW